MLEDAQSDNQMHSAPQSLHATGWFSTVILFFLK